MKGVGEESVGGGRLEWEKGEMECGLESPNIVCQQWYKLGDVW